MWLLAVKHAVTFLSFRFLLSLMVIHCSGSANLASEVSD